MSQDRKIVTAVLFHEKCYTDYHRKTGLNSRKIVTRTSPATLYVSDYCSYWVANMRYYAAFVVKRKIDVTNLVIIKPERWRIFDDFRMDGNIDRLWLFFNFRYFFLWTFGIFGTTAGSFEAVGIFRTLNKNWWSLYYLIHGTFTCYYFNEFWIWCIRNI